MDVAIASGQTNSSPSSDPTVALFPHQEAAVSVLAVLLRRHGGALLADEAGMGKTHTALAVARRYPRALVVAPAVLLDMWRAVAAKVDVAVDTMSYERLSAQARLPPVRPGLVILDEAHYVRNRGTRRYRAVSHLSWGAHLLLLSATPVHNKRRDLVSLLSLFLGSAAASLADDELARFVVRRRANDEEGSSLGRLPVLRRARWEVVPPAPEVAQAILSLPPALPPADGGRADALVRLSLLRAWCSSDAALAEALERRLGTAAALDHALSMGRHPTRRELRDWAGSGEAIQFGFAELLAEQHASGGEMQRAAVQRHADSVRTLRNSLRVGSENGQGTNSRDAERFRLLEKVLAAHPARRAVVFTHSRATAHAAFRALVWTRRVALLTGSRGLIASGDAPRRWLLDAFAHLPKDHRIRTPRACSDIARIDVLIASDVVSEGVNLPDASLVVHLDLPWTPARLEQRVGRARRLDSPHPDVVEVGIAPPLDADELRSVVVRLAEKAGISHLMLGDVAVSHPVPSTMGQSVSPRGIGAADAVERARRLTDSICTRLGATTRDGDATAVGFSGTDATVRVIGIVERTEHRDDSPRPPAERALVAVVGQEMRILTSESHATELAGLLAGIRFVHAPEICGSTPAEIALRRWCIARSASDAILANIAQRSGTHQEALRHIARLTSTVSRAGRSELLPLALAARRAVLGTAGIGGELALASLVATAPGAGTLSPTPIAWLRQLQEGLAGRARSASPPCDSWRLTALLHRADTPNE